MIRLIEYLLNGLIWCIHDIGRSIKDNPLTRAWKNIEWVSYAVEDSLPSAKSIICASQEDAHDYSLHDVLHSMKNHPALSPQNNTLLLTKLYRKCDGDVSRMKKLFLHVVDEVERGRMALFDQITDDIRKRSIPEARWYKDGEIIFEFEKKKGFKEHVRREAQLQKRLKPIQIWHTPYHAFNIHRPQGVIVAAETERANSCWYQMLGGATGTLFR